MKILLRCFALTLIALATGYANGPKNACAADDAKQGAAGNILADSGFRPKPSGFSFENWGGNQYPYSDLTPNDAVDLFGDRVCARWEGKTCVPTPATKTWLTEMNQMMKGGHCEGMAAMSAAFYQKEESPADYGAKDTFQLSAKDDPLMSAISSYFATQALEPVQSVTASTRSWPLQKIVDTLVASLRSKNDYPTLGIYGQDGGHAVTPYMVEQLPSGVYRVYVYDNNYPGAEKYVDIDTKRDHWSYAGAALNPREDPSPWEGRSGDMDLTLLSTRFEPLACPFCGSHRPPKAPPARPPAPSNPRKPSVNPDSYSIITPNRCSQVQATRKKDKKQLSAGKSGKKSEIPGASMSQLRGSRGCYIRLPADQPYDVSLVDDGRAPFSTLTDLFIFGMGQAYGVSNMDISSKAPQVFVLSDSGFSYQAGGSQKPTIIMATDTGRPNAYYEVSGFTIGDGYSFTTESNDRGEVTFSDNDPNLDGFDVAGEIVSESGDEDVALTDLDAGDKGQVELEIEDDGDLDIDIDSDSDGTADEQDADDDNDGTPDVSDNDDDNDGVADSQEKEDADYDGTPDAQDADDDNDGTPDASDADDDNDGTPDSQESDDDEPAAAGQDDSDHDGTPDATDADDDNDGTPDASDSDDDNDGTPDAQESDDDEQTAAGEDDSDHDGTPDATDADDDNDGALDASDSDDDNDGTPDAQESDDDEQADASEDDSDHDGTSDANDADDDNDGTPDASDADDDNDGTPDSQESDDEEQAAAGQDDSDHDGTSDANDADDDNDGTPDASDADDDNDGTSDAEEADSGSSDEEANEQDDGE